ncbi:tyramine/octopamine receptor-like [Littorina saxatilis]|uniref:G-protein coupled receptors family 1 profile domain-containing protein n=1 Tax=Littorina saxatilis TaxID=31220 RepID=A0AAN9C0Y5_9CAEN
MTDGNVSRYHSHIADAERHVEVVVLSVISTLASVGNISLWAVILSTRTLRQQANNKLLLCLSLADLLVSVVSMPVTVTTIFLARWVFSEQMCTVLGFINMLTLVSSVMSLGLISINRYIKVCCPQRYRRVYTNINIYLMTLGVWCLSAVLSSPPLLGWCVYDYLPRQSFCFCDWSTSVSYTFFMMLACFGGPLVMITVCNVRILQTYRDSCRRLHQQSSSAFPARVAGGQQVERLDKSSAETDRANTGPPTADRESARTTAESARTGTESARTTAESGRTGTESARTTAESARTGTESARTTAESGRTGTESARTTAESSRTGTESARTTAESGRTGTESARTTAESARTSTESTRTTAESARTGTESARTTAESARTGTESARTTAESARTSTESARTTAESARTKRKLPRTASSSSWAVVQPAVTVTHVRDAETGPDQLTAVNTASAEGPRPLLLTPHDDVSDDELMSSEVMTRSPLDRPPVAPCSSKTRSLKVPHSNPAGNRLSLSANVSVVSFPTGKPKGVKEGADRRQKRDKSRKEEFRLSLTLMVVIVVFVLCWFPFCITMLLSVFAPNTLIRAADMFTLLLGYSNSCLNPIIYGVMNKRVKDGYIALWNRACRPTYRRRNMSDTVTYSTE